MAHKTTVKYWVFGLVGLLFLLFIKSFENRKALPADQRSSSASRDVFSTSVVGSRSRVVKRNPTATVSDPNDIRNDPRFMFAIDTFDFIESEKRRFPLRFHGLARIEGLQKLLFFHDYSYAALMGGFDCAGKEAAFQQLKQTTNQIAGVPPVPVLTGDSFAQTPESVRNHHLALVQDSNSGYSNILNQLTVNAIPNPLNGQLFSDALSYTALKTELEQVLKQERNHSAGILARMEKMGSDQRSIDSMLESTTAELANIEQTLGSYRTIFERRFAAHVGEAASGIMDALSLLHLTGSGSREVGIPCP